MLVEDIGKAEPGGKGGGHTAFVGLFVPGCVAGNVLLARLLLLVRAALEHLLEELPELGEGEEGEEEGRKESKGR